MLQLAVIITLALGCHGVYIPSKTLAEDVNENFDLERVVPPNVRYYLNTQDNRWSPTPVLIGNLSTITAKPKTVFLIHGHGENAFTSLNPDVRQAILDIEDVNIISVDWSHEASYSNAVILVPLVAEKLVEFITEMAKPDPNPAINLDTIHIVGFNLGAHIAGIAARELPGIARITGLDPSGDQWGPTSRRLKFNDAAYVEVIHTDGGRFGNGIGEPIGSVNFFANGGSNQPGCITHSCSHNRAHELFAASMRNTNLVGRACTSMTQVNLNTCSGLQLRMGNNELKKGGYNLYRANTRRSHPF